MGACFCEAMTLAGPVSFGAALQAQGMRRIKKKRENGGEEGNGCAPCMGAREYTY